jgi:hypothetical protein
LEAVSEVDFSLVEVEDFNLEVEVPSDHAEELVEAEVTVSFAVSDNPEQSNSQ